MDRIRVVLYRKCNYVHFTLLVLLLTMLWVFRKQHQWIPEFLRRNSIQDGALFTHDSPTENDREYHYKNGWSIQDDPEFINYIRQKWLHHPSSVKSTLPGKDYSQLGEHKVVDDLLKQRRNGFFFEVGALDGFTYSNTLGLELLRNWTGILVEPDPRSFAKLLKLNRNAYAINACLSKNRSEIMTFIPGAAIGSLEDRNRDKKDARRTIKVQCFPLYSILLAVGVTKIDFFSLDVEGAEQTVLESIPMDKVDFGLFVIEYLDVSPEKKAKRLEEFRKHFEKVGGYKYLGEHHGVDALFQKW